MVFDLAFDYEACLVKHPSINKSDIAQLKKWAQSLDSSSTIPKDITDKQLLVFHKACVCVMEDTKKCIKVHYNLRDKLSDQLDNRDPCAEATVQAREAQEYMILPEKTDDGYNIMLHRLHDFTVENYHYAAGCKWSSMCLDSKVNEDGPENGLILLFDLRGAKLGHLGRVPIGFMAKYLNYVQDGLNARIVGIHVLNVVPLFDMIMKLMRPFLKAEVAKRIILHRVDMDWDVFYRDVIPKRCLPSDFGGDLPDTRTINKQNIERVSRNKAFFDAEEKQRHSCSKDKKKRQNIDPEFTKLDID